MKVLLRKINVGEVFAKFGLTSQKWIVLTFIIITVLVLLYADPRIFSWGPDKITVLDTVSYTDTLTIKVFEITYDGFKLKYKESLPFNQPDFHTNFRTKTVVGNVTLSLPAAVVINVSSGISDGNCSKRLGPSPVDDMAKIDALTFRGIDKYITALFPQLTKDPLPPELPVFVTAFSSNHYVEGLYLLKHIQEVVRVKYKDLKVIVYDIGLNADQYKNLSKTPNCEMRKFQFDLYPKHISNLMNFVWKPIVIQSVSKEYPLIFWMDTSLRFKTGNLDKLIEDTKLYGIMADDAGQQLKATNSIAERTLNATFAFMNETPCVYAYQSEKQGGFLLIFANQFISRYIMRPWVSCALSFGCMDPVHESYRYLYCPTNVTPHRYHLCHRFDQSVLGILYARLFHREIEKHAIDRKYFMFCKFAGIDASCLFYE